MEKKNRDLAKKNNELQNEITKLNKSQSEMIKENIKRRYYSVRSFKKMMDNIENNINTMKDALIISKNLKSVFLKHINLFQVDNMEEILGKGGDNELGDGRNKYEKLCDNNVESVRKDSPEVEYFKNCFIQARKDSLNEDKNHPFKTFNDEQKGAEAIKEPSKTNRKTKETAKKRIPTNCFSEGENTVSFITKELIAKNNLDMKNENTIFKSVMNHKEGCLQTIEQFENNKDNLKSDNTANSQIFNVFDQIDEKKSKTKKTKRKTSLLFNPSKIKNKKNINEIQTDTNKENLTYSKEEIQSKTMKDNEMVPLVEINSNFKKVKRAYKRRKTKE